MDEENPVLKAVTDVAERPGTFDPATELGLKDEDLRDAMQEVMQHLAGESQQIHGFPAIREEDLYYLFLLGLCAGYELRKTQGEKIDAAD